MNHERTTLWIDEIAAIGLDPEQLARFSSMLQQAWCDSGPSAPARPYARHRLSPLAA